MTTSRLAVFVSLIVAFQLVVPVFYSITARGDRNPGPDLTLNSNDIVFSKTKPIKGETVQMNATVHNVGDTNATNVKVRFFDGPVANNILIGTEQNLDNVPYSGTATARVNWSTASVSNGTHTIFVVIDPANAITEDNENNNTANNTIIVNLAPNAVIGVSDTSEYTWNSINFNGTGSSDLDGTITNYWWDFDDGNNSKGSQVMHSWANNGMYNVSLLVTDDAGGTDNAEITIIINNRQPVAMAYDFATLTMSNVVLDSANSTDDDGYIAGATWTLHNNTVLTGKKVSTVYPQNGIYSVNLTVTDDDGAVNFTVFQITIVNRDPVPKINSTSLKINSSENITLDAYKSYDDDGYITNYTWVFSGGKKQYGPVTTYQSPAYNGSYLVTLVIVDDDGAIASTCSTVRVGNVPPTAVAGLNDTVSTYENLTFDGTRSVDPDGSIMNYTWNFQDGTISHSSYEMHAFAQDGIYTVSLLVTDNDGATDSDTVTITVLNTPPVAYFPEITIGTYENATLNSSYSFDNDGYLANFTWDFGDGTYLYGPEVTKFWTKRGVYTVRLTVRDDDEASAAWLFNVTVNNAQPKATFFINPVNPTETQLVSFNASVSSDIDGYITNYTWNFGDNNNGYGSVLDHTYLTNGTFTVFLIITDNDGSSATATQNITVSRYNAPPVSDFTWTPSDPTTTDYVMFDASASYDPVPGAVKRYEWTWGDGNRNQLVAPKISHRFVAAGTYNVTLAVVDDQGARGSTTREIAVAAGQNHPPVAVIYAPSLSGESGVPMTFDGSSSYDNDGTLVNHSWDFNDGSSAFFPMVSHVFTNNQGTQKTFIVSLVVRDDGALTCSTSVSVTINPAVPPNARPTAILTATPNTVFTNQPVKMSAAGSTDSDGTIATNGYIWSFGDGELGAGIESYHRYTKPGIYMVLLTVKDDKGATGSASETIYVLNLAPSARAGQDITNILTIDAFNLSALGSSDPDGEIVSYRWDFGDATFATGFSVTHAYFHSGKYTVRLTVTDDNGATAQSVVNITVQNRLPMAVLTGANVTAYVGDPVLFDGSKSNDSDGRLMNYTWDFGDGTIVNGIIVSHVFTTSRVYKVKLTVQDDSGDISDANMTVTIQAKPVPPPPPKPPAKGFIPGFELVAVAVALAIGMMAVTRRRRD